MEMAEALFAKPYIRFEKSFFGLKTDVTYLPTGEPVAGTYLEYSPEVGQRIQQFLSTPEGQLEEAARKLGVPSTSPNGNIRVALCASRDHQFAAVQLFQFHDFAYHALDKPRFCEGNEAALIVRPFIK